MANTVQNIPVNVMPQAQGPVVPNNNGVIDDSAAENASMQTSNENRTHQADSQAAVENPNNNDNPVTEGKGEDFQEVLERKLSNKSEDKQSAADSEKPKDTENKNTDKSEDGTQNLSGLIGVNNQAIADIMKGNTKKVTPVVLLKGDKTAKPVTKNLITQQKIVEIPLQNALKNQAATAQKGDLAAIAATNAANAEKPTTEGATKGSEVKQAVTEATGKDAPETVVKTDATQLTDKTDNSKLNANKLTAQELAAAKQNAKAAENNNATQPTDAKKATTENVDPTAAAKTTETIDKTLKMEVLTDAKPKDTEVTDAPKITEALQADTKTDKTTAGETLEQALNEQNAKTEKKKASASVDFNYTRAQNDSAVSTTDAPAGSTTQTNTVNAVSGVQSTAATSRTDGTIQPQSPAQQIIDAARAPDVSPSSQINLTLNPEQLGRVRISFQQENGEITGLVEVEKAQTRYDIEKDIPQIVASLQDSGLQVKKIDVVQDNNPGPDQQKSELTDQFEQANKQSFSQDGSGNPRQGQSASSNRGSQLGNDYQQAKEAVSHISDDAISAYA